MFSTLIRQAQKTVETSFSHLLARAVMTIPFLVAGGFLASAIALRAFTLYGAEIGSLLMAVLFLGIGVVGVILHSLWQPLPDAVTTDHPAPADAAEPAGHREGGMSDTDRELLITALTSAAPIALPLLARSLVKNLPLLAVIAASAFVMTRPSEDPDHSNATSEAPSGLAPAE